MNVYLLKSADGKSFKIGKANDIYKRVSSLGISRFDINNMWYVPTGCEHSSYNLEGILHKIYKYAKFDIGSSLDGHTEFFNISVMESVKTFIKLHKNIYGKLTKFTKISDEIARCSYLKQYDTTDGVLMKVVGCFVEDWYEHYWDRANNDDKVNSVLLEHISNTGNTNDFGYSGKHFIHLGILRSIVTRNSEVFNEQMKIALSKTYGGIIENSYLPRQPSKSEWRLYRKLNRLFDIQTKEELFKFFGYESDHPTMEGYQL
jgi:hypothetical protein